MVYFAVTFQTKAKNLLYFLITFLSCLCWVVFLGETISDNFDLPMILQDCKILWGPKPRAGWEHRETCKLLNFCRHVIFNWKTAKLQVMSNRDDHTGAPRIWILISWNLETLQWTPNFSRRSPEDPQIWKPGYISAYPSGTSNYSPFTFPQPTPQKTPSNQFCCFYP